MNDTPVTLGTVLAALDEASRAYESAKHIADEKSRECTSALNALNQAQKAVDAAYEALKKGAPWNSDWQNRAARMKEVA